MSFFPVTITGTVIDERGECLGEAVVRLFSPLGKAVAKVRTNLGGRFSLRVVVEPGEYRLEVLLPGFSTAREIVEVKPGTEGRTLILMLRPDICGPVKIAGDKRESGIAFLGNLSWGSHFCQFYQTEKDMLDVLVPYFKAGLKNNEFCVWVTSDFLTKEHALKAMKNGVPKFSDYLAKGQMEIVPYTDWYFKGGKFDLRRTLDMGMKKHDQALSNGFAGMRATGNLYWIDNKVDWDDFACYEAELDKAIGGMKLLALCAYSLKRCGAVEILDVIKNHEFAISKELTPTRSEANTRKF